MKIYLLIAATCAAFLVRATGSPVPGSYPVPRLTLNLDSPAEERWAPVLKHWDLTQLRTLMLQAINNFIPAEAVPLVKVIGEMLDELLPYPYAAEMRGIAKTVDIDLGEITCLNMLYDLTAACTSIVAQDGNGTIWHARNLDYAVTKELRNMTAIIDFQTKGQTLYTTTSFVAQVGVFTGMKPKKFTMSLNERDNGTQAENIVELLEALILKKVKFTSFIIRDALEQDNSYSEVLERITSEEEVAPAYLIVAGVQPGEGVVITRDRIAPLDVWHLDSAVGRWFLLETNYDHWLPPPASDDRRDPGNKAMKATGQNNINMDTLWNVLSTKPVLNDQTVYTAVMCAARPDVYMSRMRDVPAF